MLGVVALGLIVASCGGDADADVAERPTSPPTLATTTTEPAERQALSAAATPEAAAGPYAATTGELDQSVADIPVRAYVPNSEAGTVSIVDPATYEVIDTFDVGVKPHHVTPSWDMQTLYVLDTEGDQLIPVDPRTSEPGEPIPVEDPYNLYFTPDGQTAVVIAERFSRIDLRDPETWELKGSIPVDHAGINHADFSADGRYLYASCEWSGWVVKVDLQAQEIVAEEQVGSEPIDVKLAPDASAVFVADQSRDGVMVLDPETLTELSFIPTGGGAHGLYYSRDLSQLYVSNRTGGSVSVVNVVSRQVDETWHLPGGGSPDMGGVSIDGSELWLSGRYDAEVYVFDTETGDVKQVISTGAGPHGLSLYPQPGQLSTGHTGVMR